MARLPSPSGPCAVGTVSLRLTDDNRPLHLWADRPGRGLFIKLWYPARGRADAPEALWAQLRTAGNLPLPMRLLLWRFRNVETSSHPALTFDTEAPILRAVIYSHGLISFASENTSLAECLASHGHVVIAVEHLDQLAEFRARPGKETNGPHQLSPRDLKTASPEQRAAMGPPSYREAADTNCIVAERATDISFVLERLNAVSQAIPGLRSGDLAHQGVLGMGLSLGGAVSTEFARRDDRCRAVINLDGGMYGSVIGDPPSIPYLMCYSSLTEGLNDALLPRGAEQLAPPMTQHLNYHDISMLMPELRLLGAVGKTKARPFIEFRNRAILDFFARHAGK